MVGDEPGCVRDAATVWLAKGSQRRWCRRAAASMIQYKNRLMHELMGKTFRKWRVALTFCRVQNDEEVAFARAEYMG